MGKNSTAFIGIDIGGTNLRGALLAGNGKILSRFRCESAISEGAESFFDRLCLNIEEMQIAASAASMKIAGIGVGVPGLIDSTGLVHASVNMRPLDGVNLSETLSKRTGVPVFCGNDANLIALGEARAGAGRGFKSQIVVTIGTGLGSGLILDGKLWSGANGFAAEFGHLTLEPDGLPCPCGNHGCLEQYVSASALSRYAGNRSPEELALAAARGDVEALQAFEILGSRLGTALSGLLNLLNIEAIIVGGGVAASFDLIEKSLLKTLHARTFPQIVASVQVRRSLLGDDAGLLGGALLAEELLKSEGLQS